MNRIVVGSLLIIAPWTLAAACGSAGLGCNGLSALSTLPLGVDAAPPPSCSGDAGKEAASDAAGGG